MNILSENVKLIEYLRCPTCRLHHYIDHPKPLINNNPWYTKDKVVRFLPLVKGSKVRQDCDKTFAYNIPCPNLLRSTIGAWYHVTPSTLQGVLGIVPCDIALAVTPNGYTDIKLHHPLPSKVKSSARLWKLASKHNKLKELEESLGSDKFGDISGKVLVSSLKVRK
jgi:hypothetical protein